MVCQSISVIVRSVLGDFRELITPSGHRKQLAPDLKYHSAVILIEGLQVC